MPDPLPHTTPRTWWALLAVAIAIAAAVTIFALFDPDPFAEGATVERGTTVILFLTAGALLFAFRDARWRGHRHLVIVPILLGFREMDFDKAFLSEGILQLRLYSGDAPIGEKLAGAAVICCVVWLLFRIIRWDLRGWVRDLRGRRAVPLVLLGAGIAVVIAKTLDGLDRKLEPFGVSLPPGVPHLLATVEESLEFGFALALFVSVLLWWQNRDRA